MTGDNIKDELDINLCANDVRVMVAEWIPFGQNLIGHLNGKLGSTKRVKGGLLFSLQKKSERTNDHLLFTTLLYLAFTNYTLLTN